MTARSATQKRASRRPCTSVIALPAFVLARSLRPNGAGRTGNTPHNPLSVSMGVVLAVGWLSLATYVFRFSANCTAQAVCPCQGSWLCRLARIDESPNAQARFARRVGEP